VPPLINDNISRALDMGRVLSARLLVLPINSNRTLRNYESKARKNALNCNETRAIMGGGRLYLHNRGL
jgi:hypothetical protein